MCRFPAFATCKACLSVVVLLSSCRSDERSRISDAWLVLSRDTVAWINGCSPVKYNSTSATTGPTPKIDRSGSIAGMGYLRANCRSTMCDPQISRADNTRTEHAGQSKKVALYRHRICAIQTPNKGLTPEARTTHHSMHRIGETHRSAAVERQIRGEKSRRGEWKGLALRLRRIRSSLCSSLCLSLSLSLRLGLCHLCRLRRQYLLSMVDRRRLLGIALLHRRPSLLCSLWAHGVDEELPLTMSWRRIACSICSGVNCGPCNDEKYIPGMGFCRVTTAWGMFGEGWA